VVVVDSGDGLNFDSFTSEICPIGSSVPPHRFLSENYDRDTKNIKKKTQLVVVVVLGVSGESQSFVEVGSFSESILSPPGISGLTNRKEKKRYGVKRLCSCDLVRRGRTYV
jgi:hypothetical protein